ncbi:MAG: hypothetical protein IJE89_05935 [Bacilli bacterium]|nr:hypothetical protein [Bacilli bacterium]
MKCKKYSYLIITILILLIGINNVNAEEKKYCYYMSSDGNYKVSLKIQWGYDSPGWHGLNDFTKVSIDKLGEKNYMANNESILNWWSNWRSKCVKGGNVCFDDYYNNSSEANKFNNGACPKYVVFQHCSMYAVWATDSKSIAEKAVKEIKNHDCTGFYASNQNASGGTLTSEEYYAEFVAEGIVEFDPNKGVTCADYESMFGDPKDDGEKYDPDGNKSASVRYMINTALQYVRIIVPILVILMGTIDFAKAVIAGKEDNMKKAQTDFIKRVLIGVAIFFVPLLVDVVMELAEYVWEGKDFHHCGL